MFKNKNARFWGAIAGVWLVVGCSSAPKDYRIFPNNFQPEALLSSPDLRLTPLAAKKLGKHALEARVTWAGFVKSVSPKLDKNGRTIVLVEHHHLAVNSALLEKDEGNVRFRFSDATGGLYQCRIAFQPAVDLGYWQEFIERKKALGCTGRILGFGRNGAPIVEAELLEGYIIDEMTSFAPELEQDGRIKLDPYGRPKYKANLER